jgi:citrate lyase subunit beta/citryl-CoA lyase
MNRSYLFVPGDSERKLAKATDAGADALILDLEDSVAGDARPAARERVREYLEGKDNTWVRINPIGTDDAERDLRAIMRSAPAGIVLPKPESAADVETLAGKLDYFENEYGIQAGRTAIMALCTELPVAVFSLGDYARATPRLAALSWGAEDLSTALGAARNRDETGNWLPPYELARSLCLFAAAAAEVAAVDTVYTDFRDAEGLSRYAANARRDGFSGMLAIHPAQVDTINAAFIPTTAEIERARQIVRLFAENPDAGTLGVDGRMVDRPHLIQAERILELAGKCTASS